MLDEATIEAIADRVAAKLAPRRVGLIDVAELARLLGVNESYVYEHQRELGVIRLGNGKKAPLRFDAERSLQLAAQLGAPTEPAERPRRRRGRPQKSNLPLGVKLINPGRRGA